MPQAWKVTRYQLGIFHQEHQWRKPVRQLISLLWVLIWGAILIWLIAGGADTRQAVGSVVRSFMQLIGEAVSRMAEFFQ